LALRIVGHFFGIEIGMAIARHMEYPYPQIMQGETGVILKGVVDPN